jgi:hypothetical protein
MGAKFGQNGVDNAALIFSNVRIPRACQRNQQGYEYFSLELISSCI